VSVSWEKLNSQAGDGKIHVSESSANNDWKKFCR